ncbi:MAG: hypothetical protein GY755_16560 [Chloroflexi bacterium]|nr:hypothetical protein [Chloroflexota bacterium]
MGKGRSEKPSFEQYIEEMEWEKTHSRNSRSAYKGTLLHNSLFGSKHSWIRKFLFLVLILGLLFSLILFLASYFLYSDEESLAKFIGLLSISVIVWFAGRDTKNKK